MTRLRFTLLLSFLCAGCGPTSVPTDAPPVDSPTFADADGDRISDRDEGFDGICLLYTSRCV